ncbi:MAG TPA: MBL fold metallo-hydrolase, partial [Novosphingobium sp.]|nr:MBL fold metallo-hydrolase [Novosphingobium sp.]
TALEALRKIALARLEGTQVVLPEIGETYELPAGAPARRTRTGRTDLSQALGRDWQNAYAQLATSLKHDLAAIKDARQREEAIAAMRQVLDSYTRFRADKHGKARRR